MLYKSILLNIINILETQKSKKENYIMTDKVMIFDIYDFYLDFSIKNNFL